jgi:molybdate transport system substrate-binding protein
MRRAAVLVSGVLLAVATRCNAETVLVYAAGSLRPAFTEIGRNFEADAGTSVQFEFGASGLLKDRIVAGEPAQVFASANTEHPQELLKTGKAQSVAVFARNQLCALVAPTVPADVDLLAAMLNPTVKLGTSTPKADPSGDYAWEVFRKADAIKPGSFNALSRKALQLTGGPHSATPPPDRTVYGMLVAENKADIFLTYCTNATLAMKEQPQLRVLDLPPALAVGAEYGVAVMSGAPASASQFVDFLRGTKGQSILRKFGFR